jgi:hypothetical protein
MPSAPVTVVNIHLVCAVFIVPMLVVMHGTLAAQPSTILVLTPAPNRSGAKLAV